MNDPRHRLYRPVLGERRLELRPVVRRVAARDRDIERKDPVAAHREPIVYKVRRLTPGAEAAPNAPQLIRLVRSPFQLDRSYPKRVPGGERARIEPRERINVAATVVALRTGNRREPFPRPTDCHPPVRRPVRPPLSAWLGGEE